MPLPQTQVIEGYIVVQIAAKLDRAFTAAQSGIAAVVRNAILPSLVQAPEYPELIAGRLWHELGFLEPQATVRTIANRLGEGVVARNLGVYPAGNNLRGGMRVEVFPGTYDDVLSLDVAKFVSEHGFQVDWLRWLLLEGDNPIIYDYTFIAGHQQWSRTGEGIMVPSVRGWRVPSEHAGTPDDNWITRSLIKMIDGLAEQIGAEIQRHV
jgi:hypothetical protein